MAADWFLPLDEVGLRCLTEANGVNVSYPPGAGTLSFSSSIECLTLGVLEGQVSRPHDPVALVP